MSETVRSLLEEFWSWRLKQTPEFATFAGDKRYNNLLESWTETRFAADHKTCLNFLDQAKTLLKNSTDDGDKQNLEFLISELTIFTDGYIHGGYYFPLNYMEGLHVDFQRLAEWATPSTVKDYQDIISRYGFFLSFAKDVIETMRSGVAKKVTNHSVSMRGVVDNCKKLANEEAEKSPFFEPFSDLKCGSEEEKEQLQKGAKDAIETSIKVGFGLLAEFIEKEYLPACRPEIAATSLPKGEEFYKACLKFHTTTNLTAEEIHQMGLKEVARIEDEMNEIKLQLGDDIPLKDFIEKLRVDKTNYFQAPNELLESGHDIVFNKIYPNLTKIFTAVPRTKLVINETPSGDYPAGFYLAGTEDGSRPAAYSLNAVKYDSQPKYEMISLSLHEACPGHHLQGSYLLEKSGVPEFRKVMEDRNYFQSPSRFPFYTAFVEGWALYCETLGTELGLYDNPLDRFGHLSEDIFRACRLVVDTGMHALGWTIDMAVDYMMEHSAASRDNIVGEVNRYVTWPGQAVGYKVGQMKILELREMAKKELEDKFDIKKFHDAVLESAGPVNILEKNVMAYIDNNKN